MPKNKIWYFSTSDSVCLIASHIKLYPSPIPPWLHITKMIINNPLCGQSIQTMEYSSGMTIYSLTIIDTNRFFGATSLPWINYTSKNSLQSVNIWLTSCRTALVYKYTDIFRKYGKSEIWNMASWLFPYFKYNMHWYTPISHGCTKKGNYPGIFPFHTPSYNYNWLFKPNSFRKIYCSSMLMICSDRLLINLFYYEQRQMNTLLNGALDNFSLIPISLFFFFFLFQKKLKFLNH